MEVHAHTHTPRKKWTHYFWEFLMLFLAVFCGFLAENEREHFVERRREIQFMKMMLEDLKHDTTELSRVSRFISRGLKSMDTCINILFLTKLSSKEIVDYYRLVPFSIYTNVRVDLQDRTEAQLKNAGNLRLIHNKKVRDSLASYWYSNTILQNTWLPNYESDRRIVKDMIFTLFNYDNFIDRDPRSGINKDKQLLIVNYDFPTRMKLGNYLKNMQFQLTGGPLAINLKQLRDHSDGLIKLIKKEYHLN